MVIYTVGHSNVSAGDLTRTLRAWDVKLLVDVRRYPSSRRHPHFNGPALAAHLEAHGLRYRHEEPLGGYRQARPDSPNSALDDGFRGYADYMSSRPFQDSVVRLIALSRVHVTAVMCAEVDPERCHRRFLADALAVRDLEVVHILSADSSRRHELHPTARVGEDGRLVYPDPGPRQMELFS